MTNEQAQREAKKRWGNKFYIRNGESFSSPEKRDKNREDAQKARAEIDGIEADIKRRLSELGWYQELRDRQAKLRKDVDKARGWSMYHRFIVGKTNGMFNEILGQGDTWEEAFAKADNKSK